MAFEAKGLGSQANSGGVGGTLHYAHKDDNLAAIKGNGYWNTTTLEGGELEARTAAEDFVRLQQVHADNGVLMHINAKNGVEVVKVVLGTSGRLEPASSADFIIT